MTKSLEHITIHWTGGNYNPSNYEKSHYHFLIDGNGDIHHGKYKPEDNVNTRDKKYAAHTAMFNTGNIGVSYCGMAGFSSKQNMGDYPLKPKQIEAGFKLVAELAEKYDINIGNIKTHYERGLDMPITANSGKIDIVYLPSYPDIGYREVGNFIRQKVKWYMDQLKVNEVNQ